MLSPLQKTLKSDAKKVAANKEEIAERTKDIFSWIKNKELKIRIRKDFKLSEAKNAHEELEGRKSSGKILLVP